MPYKRILMPIQGRAALDLSGTTEEHSRVFQEAANKFKSVIGSRAVGKWATGLLEEGYATKGFHDKAKSCNWGPMAGFVLSDPRFTKRGDSRSALESQRKDLIKAFKSGAGEIPLYISNARLDAITGELGCATLVSTQSNGAVRLYSARSPTGRKYRFQLEKVNRFKVPKGHGEIASRVKGSFLWSVNYADGEVSMPGRGLALPKRNGVRPVMAMVDPDCKVKTRGSFLSATTGDYDLWAIFPQRSVYDRRGKDKRPVKNSDRFAQPISAFIAQEDPHLGNITGRGRDIRTFVNRLAAHPGGDIVHHSDEAGRPLVDDIDLPAILWVPGARDPVGLRTIQELRLFIASLRHEYQLIMNPGWFKDLRIGVSMGGSYEV